MTRPENTAAAATAPTTKDPLAGHLGHLNPTQETAFTKFKELCAEKGLYKPAAGTSGLPSHDDGTLLRFLRARQFDVQAAWKQFSDTEKWRNEVGIDKLYDNVEVDEYEQARIVYPQWTGGRDKRGIPVYLFRIRDLKGDKMKAYAQPLSGVAAAAPAEKVTTKPQLLKLFALYENMTQFVLPLCSAVPGRPNPETPVVSTNNIVDISGVGLMHFWNLKAHMQDASTLATAHYPETLDRIFIIGAPSFFPRVWGWIKQWFDPVTTSKIFILGDKDVKPTLTKFIDPERLPKKYGGELDWDWGMHPILDPEMKKLAGNMYNEKGEWVPGPVRFYHGANGEKAKIVAVGHVGGKPRAEVRAEVVEPELHAPAVGVEVKTEANGTTTTNGVATAAAS